jgi:hypothetical protein
MAYTVYKYMMKKFDPDSSPSACTWPVQPICMMKEVFPGTSTACT